MHKRSLALLHSKMSTLHTILDRLPKPMDDTPNTEQMFADENHDFIKLFNGNANFNDETEIHNDLPYPTDDTYCIYYTPDEVAQTIGNENNQLSIFSLNCRSINANWDSLNQLIYNMTTDHCRFDFIGLTEVFKFHDDFNYSIQGYPVASRQGRQGRQSLGAPEWKGPPSRVLIFFFFFLRTQATD